MRWWTWIKTGIIACAQIVAWFATSLQIMSAETLIEDSISCGKKC